jgi:hypothetical protein
VYYCEYQRGKHGELALLQAATPEQERIKAEMLLAGIRMGEATPEEKKRQANARDGKRYRE